MAKSSAPSEPDDDHVHERWQNPRRMRLEINPRAGFARRQAAAASDGLSKSSSQPAVGSTQSLAERGRKLDEPCQSRATAGKELDNKTEERLNKEAIRAFASWAEGKTTWLHELFGFDEEGGCQSISVGKFVKYLVSLGFNGDIFRVVHAIKNQSSDSASRKYANGIGITATDEIFLSQLRRFERCKTVIDAAATERDNEPLSKRFSRLLGQQHGSLLRAFRLDIDLRGTGSVAYPDFARACRRLGLNGEPRRIWDSFRPGNNAAPLTLVDIAPEEAKNAGSFIKFLRLNFNSDIDHFWNELDCDGNGHVTLNEWTRVLEEMGFSGDARLLFHGLDSSGIGRLWRNELEYLTTLKCTTRAAFKPPTRSRDAESSSSKQCLRSRPAWDSTVCNVSRHNTEITAISRKYFGGSHERPVRQQIHEELRAKASAQGAAHEEKVVQMLGERYGFSQTFPSDRD